MFWQYSKIVVLNTSFFEKIMKICIIIATYLSQICLILASYMSKYGYEGDLTTLQKMHSECWSCECVHVFQSLYQVPSPSKLSHMSKDYFLFHIDADNIQIYKYRNSFHIGKLSLLWLSCDGRKQQVPLGDAERQKFWYIISTLYIVIAFSAGRM